MRGFFSSYAKLLTNVSIQQMGIENPDVKNTIEQEKPPFLYHGSPHGGVEELNPSRKKQRDINEGPKIFATPNLWLATLYMANESGKDCGTFNGTPYTLIIGSREEFIAKDKGGHIYVLPSDKFTSNPDKGLGRLEWTSDEKVKPIKTIEFKSTLDAIIENGVQVYFVDAETRAKIKNASDHGLAILKNLKSENTERGINAKSLDNE